MTQLHSVAARPAFRAALERHLEEYGKTRGAVSELAGSLITLAAGYAALSKATPGALSAGTAEEAIDQHLAIANFWLGSTVGAWYYAVFPVSVSAGLVAATSGAMIAAVGVLTALAWIVIDPLLANTGIHRRRLDRFVTALGEELRGATAASIGSVITISRGCSMHWISCEPPPKRYARRFLPVGPVYPYLLKHLTFPSLNLTLESSDSALSLAPFGEVIPHATYPLGSDGYRDDGASLSSCPAA